MISQESKEQLILEAVDSITKPTALYNCWCPACHTKHRRILSMLFQFSPLAEVYTVVPTSLLKRLAQKAWPSGKEVRWVFPCVECADKAIGACNGL